jgi:hypothetical protein
MYPDKTHHSRGSTSMEEHNRLALIHTGCRSQFLDIELVISEVASGSSDVTPSDVEEVSLV